MLKVKYTYKYPISAPVDRLALQVQRDEKIPDTIAMYQTVQKTLTAKKYIDTEKNMWVVEAEVTEEFDAFTAVLKDVPRDGLVGEWLFFEGSGTTLHDTSGQGNNGTINGMTWDTLPTGKVVGSFDGVDDYVLVSNSPSLDITDEITVMAWAYFNAFDRKWHHIVGKAEGDGRDRYYIAYNNLDQFVFGYYGQDGAYHNCAVQRDINAKEWHLFAFTWDGNEIKAYIDTNLKETISSTAKIATGNNLIIGQRGNNVSYFNGFIGLVRIYNRALDPSEIEEIYQLEAPLFGITP